MLRQIALATKPFAGSKLATGDLVENAIANGDGCRSNPTCSVTSGGSAAQIASIAEGASGSVWPPSTTIVWPVMNLASSDARKSAA